MDRCWMLGVLRKESRDPSQESFFMGKWSLRTKVWGDGFISLGSRVRVLGFRHLSPLSLLKLVR